MAITRCNQTVTANAAPNCDTPLVAGLLDTAIAWHFSDIELVKDATNNSKVTAYTVRAGAKPFAIYADEKLPFADAATTVNTATLKNTYDKTLPFMMPMGGADAAKQVIDPVVQSTEGFIVFVKTKNKVADGSVVVFGAHTGLMCSEGTRNYTDPNLGAAFKANMTEVGAHSETVTFVGEEATPTYAGVMAEWETLLALVTY